MAKRLKNRLFDLLRDKEKREQRRITQSEIARAIGVMPSTINGWIQQESRRLDEHVVVGLCEYFGCELDDLLYITEDNQTVDKSQEIES